MTDSIPFSHPKYLLDSSCLVQAHRAHYPMDVFPSFWTRIGAEIAHGKVLVLDKVVKEISRNKDVLWNWLEPQMTLITAPKSVEEEPILVAYGRIMMWSAGNPQYSPQAKEDFAAFEYADPWLVACASAEGLTVVSQEKSAPDSKREIKLPDACAQFNVRHIDTLSFLREIGFTS